ncbi:alpha-L-rhamnosidase [Niabella drilacis]|uniref:alpha-L-rhamnosidase n=1 Tax=Niabella drilacis (strain DSM 25811 / CCM 8410 / CCUG 62505 / LMG 26954 / E90) TaxID=1285928 RepID=A0A1G6XMX4_NIADE|nr:alpha-L-rhamnosidase [Niabella drilacis]SDD79579.1 alpha-L-rhamnosidase [Niabella drilacis]
MNKKKPLAFIAVLFSLTVTAQSKVGNLRTENRVDPVGLDIIQPRFSWQLENGKRNVMQTAYEIRVTHDKAGVWNSGKVSSDSSVHVTYKGAALKSGEKYQWQVRVWDNSGKASSWSSPAIFQMALLQPSDWKATWITPGYEEDATLRPSPLMRKEFSITKKVVRATAYITAHGMYEAAINGSRVGDAHFTPGWTSYKKRLQYQTYDITSLLKQGTNALGVTLGSGWYRGHIGFSGQLGFYGKDIALLLQLRVDYADGTQETIVSDSSWKSATGAITYSEIYNGETIDARKDRTGWMLAGYRDEDWTPVKTASFDKGNLLATYNEMITAHEVFKPVKVLKTPAGETVLDFGQNLVGWVRIKVRGSAGDSVTLKHAEVLTKAGNFYTENLRAAKAQNTYVLKGGTEETFYPHFTWQGFRYVKVEGYPGTLTPDNFEAIAFYSDMEPTGTFTTSNPLINQLQHNIQWGQKGNFLDVPTDCPQRDERLGWTGDAQAFFRTAAFNMGVNNFFTKWLKDLEADQIDGRVPFVIPNILGNGANSAGWADVATIIPWQMYLAYGDTRTLAAQYSSMKNYVESVRKTTNNDLWNTGFHFGDWLFYHPQDDNDGRAAVTDKYLIAQCFYAHSVQLLINAATVLGNTEDATAYAGLLKNIKAAFVKEYMTPSGRLVSGTQTAYVLALHFDMLPEPLRKQAAERLVENIKSYNNHLTTGFLGTPYLCHVLTRFGYTDMAYTLLLQETYPSWLYPVKMGATTIWERWDGIKPDGSFQAASMNSYNHYAYGAIGDWMYRTMVGLDTEDDGVGYKHIKVKPHIGGDFKNASASLKTYYGTTKAGWEVADGKIMMEVEIPANTRATIYLPVTDAGGVTESGKPLSSIKEIKQLGPEDGYLKIETGSGTYRFGFPGK